MKAFFRGSLMTLVGSVALFGASTAFAADEPCFNDTDCPGGGAVCGGDVCNWNKSNPAGTMDKPYTCNPAGTDPKGQDGWCTSTNGNADCKCASAGAKCVGVHCSFTKASDAPAGGGSPAGGASTGGSPAAGSPATGGAGSPATTGGSPTTTGGSAATPPAAAESSGCSVSAPIGSRSGAALALGLLGLGLAFSRRRR